MNNYPEYVEINNKKYKINTDYRVAIRCNSIAENNDISDYERSLAIIYLLFGDDGLKDENNYEKLLNLGKKYLSCCKKIETNKKEKPDMDYIEDFAYIKTSFLSDYGINIDDINMHWWEFSDLINGLSNSEFGNCCILNRIRNLRNFDVKEIKDSKERQKIIEAKKQVELKKYKQETSLTKEQKESMERFNQIIGI